MYGAVENNRGVNYGKIQMFLNYDMCPIRCIFEFLQSIVCPGTELLQMVIQQIDL